LKTCNISAECGFRIMFWASLIFFRSLRTSLPDRQERGLKYAFAHFWPGWQLFLIARRTELGAIRQSV
jgi:hypothetical protein